MHKALWSEMLTTSIVESGVWKMAWGLKIEGVKFGVDCYFRFVSIYIEASLSRSQRGGCLVALEEEAA